MNDLWEGQSMVLADWEERRREQDLVIKLNTGGGKTLVGLLMAQALVNELQTPALYLCPTVQLVEQALRKAAEVHISAVQYETGAAPLPTDFRNGDAILVATYQALFHGQSKFGLRGSGSAPIDVGVVICDDAHTAFSAIRDQFTVAIKKENHSDLYRELVGRFTKDFEDLRLTGKLNDVLSGDDAILEVPHWAWAGKSSAIETELLNSHRHEFRYNLPLITGSFHSCHAFITREEFAITPVQPLVDRFPTFVEAGRRIYMSATIADDSSIVQTFGAPAKAVRNPIAPRTLAGVGERMILAPGLTEMDMEDVLPTVKKMVERLADRRVVVLAPSEKIAREWEDVGEVKLGDEVAPALERLTQGQASAPIILPNRYDGIDLPDDACRVLILDGLPRGANTYELFRSRAVRGASGFEASVAQRVEQGLGRATRGSGDYCVILLMGRDLLEWVARRKNLGFISTPSRVQLEIGHEVSESLSTARELWRTIHQCLKRDQDWVEYHSETLAERVGEARSSQSSEDGEPLGKDAVWYAERERAYLDALEQLDYSGALRIALDVAGEHHREQAIRGWYLQLASKAAVLGDDLARGAELQRNAYAANKSLQRPKAKPAYRPLVAVGDQAKRVADIISDFQIRSGVLHAYDEATSPLLNVESSTNRFELALRELGTYLGFESTRPEREIDDGPDNLWLDGNGHGLVIEAKTDKKRDNPLFEREHDQLLGSVGWFRKVHGDREPIPIIVHANDRADPKAHAEDTWVLTIDSLRHLTSVLREVLRELAATAEGDTALRQETARHLRDAQLDVAGLQQRFLTKFRLGAATR